MRATPKSTDDTNPPPRRQEQAEVGQSALASIDPARLPALFRQLNELTLSTFGLWYPSGDLDVFCECADCLCFDLICLPPEHYDAVRCHPDRFIVTPAHAESGFDTVLERRASFAVVTHEEGQRAEQPSGSNDDQHARPTRRAVNRMDSRARNGRVPRS